MAATRTSNSRPVAGADMSRRRMLRLTGVLAAASVAGCAPVRIALRWTPSSYATDASRVPRTLHSFVATLVPGADTGAPDLARVLTDSDYPFAPYAGTFAADLDGRARRLCGVSRFDLLEPAERTRVVQDGLRADGATRRLYAGAIFLAHIAFYAGIYSEDGCNLIGFDGRFRFRSLHDLRYPDTARFATVETSSDGNPH